MPNQKRQRQKQGREIARQAAQAEARKRQLRRNFITALIVTAVIALLFTYFTRDDGDDTASKKTTTTTATGCPKVDGSSPRKIDFSGPPPQCTSPEKKYTAVFDTSEGTIEAELANTETPNTVNNFVFLSRYQYYKDTKVFRLAESIDIWQSGSPHTQDNADEGPGYNIQDEGKDYTYAEGDLVMARQSTPNSASAQYFFAAGPETSRIGGPNKGNGEGTYVKFGKVTKGLDVVKKIMAMHPEDPDNAYEGAPDKDVTIRNITIRES